MKRVAASEFELLTVARALFRTIGDHAVTPLLRQPRRAPDTLGPTATHLLEQICARGAVLELCRRGGWRSAAHLQGGEVVTGRLWRRRAPEALRFSTITIDVLRYLLAAPLARPTDCPPLAGHHRPELGDELVLYLACDLAARCGYAEPLTTAPLWRHSVICWLGFFPLLARHAPPHQDELGPAVWEAALPRSELLLEALQLDLFRRWLAAERDKVTITSAALMVAIGVSQQQIVDGLCSTLERMDRRDLARFLIEAADHILRSRPEASRLISGLSRETSLEERQRAFCAAGALLAGLEPIRRWVDQAQATRFFDDSYAASQLLLGLWEPIGAVGLAHAREVVQQLQTLDAALTDGREEMP